MCLHTFFSIDSQSLICRDAGNSREVTNSFPQNVGGVNQISKPMLIINPYEKVLIRFRNSISEAAENERLVLR